MFGRIWEWIKSHPYWSAGIVVGLVVLWLLMRGRGGSSSSGVTDEGVAAATRIQAASAENITYQQTQAQVALGAQQVDIAKAAVSAQQDVTNRQTAAAVDLAKVQAGMMEKLADYSYKSEIGAQGTAVSLATLQADVAKTGIAADVTKTQINSATATSIAKINAAQAKYQAQLGALTSGAKTVADAQKAAYVPGGWMFGNPLGTGAYADLMKWISANK